MCHLFAFGIIVPSQARAKWEWCRGYGRYATGEVGYPWTAELTIFLLTTMFYERACK